MAAVLGTTCAWAADSSGPGPQEAAAAAANAPVEASAGKPDDATRKELADRDKRVCKRTVVTGSRFAKQVCHTQAEWDELAQSTRGTMRDIDARPAPLEDR